MLPCSDRILLHIQPKIVCTFLFCHPDTKLDCDPVYVERSVKFVGVMYMDGFQRQILIFSVYNRPLVSFFLLSKYLGSLNKYFLDYILSDAFGCGEYTFGISYPYFQPFQIPWFIIFFVLIHVCNIVSFNSSCQLKLYSLFSVSGH